MNNITLAHIGGELVLIGGVAFYFQKKTSMLQHEINTLKKDNELMIETIEDLQEGIQQLGSIVMKLQHHLGVSHHVSHVSQNVKHSKHNNPTHRKHDKHLEKQLKEKVTEKNTTPINPLGGLMSMMMTNMMPAMPAEKNIEPVVFPPSKKIVNDVSESDEETIDDNDLDHELSTEYKLLDKERQDCEGDTCKL